MPFARVAAVSDVPVGEMRVFRVNGRSVLLANVGGVFYAIDDLCTHDGGPLGDGELMGDQVECPRHGARFDVKTGRVTAFPAGSPVGSYAVEVAGEEVRVDVG